MRSFHRTATPAPTSKLSRPIGGPFTLKGEATFGHLNADSTKFVTGDFQYGQIDVYNYSPAKVRFAYMFNRGFSPSELVEGAAFNPRSTE